MWWSIWSANTSARSGAFSLASLPAWLKTLKCLFFQFAKVILTHCSNGDCHGLAKVFEAAFSLGSRRSDKGFAQMLGLSFAICCIGRMPNLLHSQILNDRVSWAFLVITLFRAIHGKAGAATQGVSPCRVGSSNPRSAISTRATLVDTGVPNPLNPPTAHAPKHVPACCPAAPRSSAESSSSSCRSRRRRTAAALPAVPRPALAPPTLSWPAPGTPAGLGLASLPSAAHAAPCAHPDPNPVVGFGPFARHRRAQPPH